MFNHSTVSALIFNHKIRRNTLVQFCTFEKQLCMKQVKGYRSPGPFRFPRRLLFSDRLFLARNIHTSFAQRYCSLFFLPAKQDFNVFMSWLLVHENSRGISFIETKFCSLRASCPEKLLSFLNHLIWGPELCPRPFARSKGVRRGGGGLGSGINPVGFRFCKAPVKKPNLCFFPPQSPPPTAYEFLPGSVWKRSAAQPAYPPSQQLSLVDFPLPSLIRIFKNFNH